VGASATTPIERDGLGTPDRLLGHAKQKSHCMCMVGYVFSQVRPIALCRIVWGTRFGCSKMHLQRGSLINYAYSTPSISVY
jgi:hypothetical protein